jgi:hypothetical protein
MISQRRRWALGFVSIGLSQVLSIGALANTGSQCPELSSKAVLEGLLEPSLATPVKRFPTAVDPENNPNAFIQYGFESEYGFSEIPGMLAVYRPADERLINRQAWDAMTLEQRAKWTADNKAQLFPEMRQEGGLILGEGIVVPQSLPKRLIVDTTGNVEIITKPMETLEEWFQTVSWVNSKFGVGSMQTTISSETQNLLAPRNFPAGGGIPQVKGMLNITQELATFEKLDSGYDRYAKDQTKPVAQSFQHPFLGPMTLAKQKLMYKYIEGNAVGKLYSKEELSFVSGNDTSFKYVGGTAYRPDIVGQKRAIIEVRDAHKNFELLRGRVLWANFALVANPKTFTAGAEIPAMDTAKDFDRLPIKVKSMLQNLFPNKAHAGEQYTAEELFANDVFRNFAFPLRNTSGIVKLVGKPELTSQIQGATDRYVNKLVQIEAQLAANAITKSQAELQVQGELTAWARESGIPQALREWRQKTVFESPEWKKFISTLPKEIRDAPKS